MNDLNGFQRRIWKEDEKTNNTDMPAGHVAPASSPITRPLEMEDTLQPLLWLIVAYPVNHRGLVLPIPPNATIGRRGDVRWADNRISRQHARVLWVDAVDGTAKPGFLLVPLQDRNGTMVNGRQIKRPTQIQENDTLIMGNTHFVVKVLY